MASRSLGTLTLDLIARIGGFQQGMDQAARSTQRSMGQVVRHSESASESVTGSFKAIAGAAAAFLSVQQLVEYSQTWLGVQNRIKQVSETFDEFSKQSSAVFFRLRRTRSPPWRQRPSSTSGSQLHRDSSAQPKRRSPKSRRTSARLCLPAGCPLSQPRPPWSSSVRLLRRACFAGKSSTLYSSKLLGWHRLLLTDWE